jgi:hypothetical protein
MNYNIYVSRLSPDADVQEYAVEIQPPLESVALDGLVKRLTARSPRESNYMVEAEDVTVVRQDDEGTALIVTPSESFTSTAESIGHEVAFTLDPCNLDVHTMNVQLVDGHYGLGE